MFSYGVPPVICKFIFPFYLLYFYIQIEKNAFSADPLLLKSIVLLEKKQFLGSVLVFEQKTEQRQLNAQINNNSVLTYFCEIDTGAVFTLFEDIQIKVYNSRLHISTASEPKSDKYKGTLWSDFDLV